MSTENSIKVVIRKINRLIGKAVNAFEVVSLMFCMGALTILLIANVIAREFFQSIYFAEEITEFLLIFVTFVGVSYGVRRARHIRMGAFLDIMPPKIEKIFILTISVFSAWVMFVMAHATYQYLLYSMRSAHETPALRLPYWIFYVIMPIGFTMAGLQYIRTIMKNVLEKDPWLSPEQQSEYEEVAG
jgi:TRAP-type C4-dicarboxylate transport system permease small subunit